jgi:hypothetical protein
LVFLFLWWGWVLVAFLVRVFATCSDIFIIII